MNLGKCFVEVRDKDCCFLKKGIYCGKNFTIKKPLNSKLPDIIFA